MNAKRPPVPARLCACGCGQTTNLARRADKAGRWAYGEPLRYRYGHYKPQPKPLSEIVWSRIDVRGPDECWPWTGSTSPRGYGKCDRGRIARLVLAEKLGRDLTRDEVTRHTCDNPPCCNPDHLLPGSNADNSRDAVERGRMRGERNARAKLTYSATDEIRALYATGQFRQIDLAQRFGVSQPTVSKVVLRQTWATC